MTGTFSTTDAVELAVVERSGFVESRHAGSAVVLAPDGTPIRALGDPAAPVFPRSSLKPFQAIGVMSTGVTLTGPAAALATASHAGTPAHVSVVTSMLARAGLTTAALQCVSDWPKDDVSRENLIRADGTRAPVYMNCSGKHAAMLLACVQNGWPTENYLDPAHPVQLAVRDVVERLTGERISATGIDGCGAPVHAVSLSGLARGIHRIATATTGSPFALHRNAATLVHAALENGWAIDGPGRANSLVIDRLGVFAKGGAEGVMVMAAPDGTTVALKILDGSLRAASIVALSLLADAGAVGRESVQQLAPELDLAVYGGGRPVGEIRASYR